MPAPGGTGRHPLERGLLGVGVGLAVASGAVRHLAWWLSWHARPDAGGASRARSVPHAERALVE